VVFAPRIDIDLNNVIVVVVNARCPFVVGGGHHRWREHGKLLHANGGHG
jgi:hypothetical protein